MKRFFALSMLVLAFTACNNAGDGTGRIKDSLDSIKNLKIESIDEAAQAAKDTISQSHDSLINKVDSIGGQARDSINQIRK
jgi:cellobiose-specific phosphotransferase system component IIA